LIDQNQLIAVLLHPRPNQRDEVCPPKKNQPVIAMRQARAKRNVRQVTLPMGTRRGLPADVFLAREQFPCSLSASLMMLGKISNCKNQSAICVVVALARGGSTEFKAGA